MQIYPKCSRSPRRIYVLPIPQFKSFATENNGNKNTLSLVLLLRHGVDSVSCKTKLYFTVLLIPSRHCVSLLWWRLAEFMQRREHEATEWPCNCDSQNLLTESGKCGRYYVTSYMLLKFQFVLHFIPHICSTELLCQNCHVKGWSTALQAGSSRVQLPMGSLGFFIDLILLAAMWPRGLTEMSTRDISWGSRRSVFSADKLNQIHVPTI